MANRYAELRNKQQAEVNAFPMGFAFSDKQFEEMMAKWGLTPDDTDKIYRGPGGMFYRKSDAPALHEMMARHDREMKEAIAADETGEGFIYEMFSYELANHEYGYTLDPEDTLEALGYTLDEIKADERLRRGIWKAAKEIEENPDEY